MDDKNKRKNGAADAEKVNNDGERKILSTPVVRTGDGTGLHIPDSETDEINIGTARFIKSGETPFVSSVKKEEEKELPTDISRFTDRLTARAPERKAATGYTGKIKTYPENHAAAVPEARMIAPDAESSADNSAGGDGDMKIISSEKEITNKPDDEIKTAPAEEKAAVENSPTKHIESKSELLREIAGTADEDVRLNPDQLMMDGFEAEKQDGEKSDDSEIAAALHETRQKRINSFTFWSKKSDNDDAKTSDERFSTESERVLPGFFQSMADKFAGIDSSFVPVKSEEYTDFNNRKNIFIKLIGTRKSVLIKTFITAFLGIVLFIIDLAADISAGNNNGFFTIFGGSYVAYTAVNLVFLLAVMLILATDIKNGVVSLLKIRPKADTFLAFMLTVVFAQNFASFFTQLKIEENFHMLTPAAIMLCVPYLLAKLFYYDNTRQCFKAVAARSEKSYLRKISDPELTLELLREKSTGDENLVYSGKTKFIKSFIARSADSAFAGMPSSRLVLLCIGVSVVAGVSAAIINRSPVYGFTAAALTAVLSFPVSCIVATGFNIASENKKLSVKSSFVQSYSDARDFASVDNLVIDSADIFEAKIGTVMAAKNVREKQAMFCAAVLCCKAGGILGEALKASLTGLETKIPEVESLVYEDKLGLSAWISGCKVLLGTHTLLINHNVSVPDEKLVTRLLEADEKPVFLAIEGNFAAVFGVTYSCKTSAYDNLNRLVSGGTNLLFCTRDANLSDTFAEQLLGLPSGSVRIISQKAVGMLSNAKAAVTDEEEAGIVFTDSIESLCRCAGAAVMLDRTKTISKAVCTAGSAAGLVLALALIFTGVFTKTSAIIPVLIQLIWIAACFAAPMLFAGAMPAKKKKAPFERAKEAAENTDDEYDLTENADGASDDLDDSHNAVIAEEKDEADENISSAPEKTVPEKPAPEETENENVTVSSLPPVEDVNPHHISAETFNVLDKLADTQSRTGKKDDAKSSGDDDDDNDNDNNTAPKGLLSKLKKGFSAVLSGGAKNDGEADGGDDDSDDGDTEKTGGKGVVTPEEEAYNERRAEEERTRQKFTPPEMPKAPHFDLNEPRPDFSESEKRRTAPPTVFTDSMFRAFTNDDDVFAGLRETRSDKFDF